MPSLKDLIVECEKDKAGRFQERYEQTIADIKMFPFPLGENYLDTIEEKTRKFIIMAENGEKLPEVEEEMVCVGLTPIKRKDPFKVAVRDRDQARISLYEMMLEHDGQDYTSFPEAYRKIFGSKAHYLTSTESIVTGFEWVLTLLRDHLKLKSDIKTAFGKCVPIPKWVEEQIADEIFSPQEHQCTLLDRYKIIATLYEKRDKTYQPIREAIKLNQYLVDPDIKVIFGISPPDASPFRTHPLQDRAVAPQHGEIKIHAGHLAYFHLTAVYPSIILNNEKRQRTINTITGVKLVPKDFNGDRAHPRIYYGTNAHYCIGILLEKK